MKQATIFDIPRLGAGDWVRVVQDPDQVALVLAWDNLYVPFFTGVRPPQRRTRARWHRDPVPALQDLLDEGGLFAPIVYRILAGQLFSVWANVSAPHQRTPAYLRSKASPMTAWYATWIFDGVRDRVALDALRTTDPSAWFLFADSPSLARFVAVWADLGWLEDDPWAEYAYDWLEPFCGLVLALYHAERCFPGFSGETPPWMSAQKSRSFTSLG